MDWMQNWGSVLEWLTGWSSSFIYTLWPSLIFLLQINNKFLGLWIGEGRCLSSSHPFLTLSVSQRLPQVLSLIYPQRPNMLLFVHLFIHWLDVAASCTHISSPQWLKCCLHQPVVALSSSLILAKPAGLLPCFHSHFPHSVLCSKWGI